MPEVPLIETANTISHTSPGLAHFKIGLHVQQATPPTWMFSLLDSGCTDNLISVVALESLVDFSKAKVAQTASKTLRTANNDQSQLIHGKITLFLSLLTTENERIAFAVNFFVVSGLIYQIFLGQSFLTSPFIMSQDVRHITFRTGTGVHKVQKIYKNDIHLKAANHVTLQPGETRKIRLKLSNPFTDVFREDLIPYIRPTPAINLLAPFLQIKRQLINVQDENIHATVQNTHDSPISLPQIPVAQLCFMFRDELIGKALRQKEKPSSPLCQLPLSPDNWEHYDSHVHELHRESEVRDEKGKIHAAAELYTQNNEENTCDAFSACLNDTSNFPMHENELAERQHELDTVGYSQLSVTEAINKRETPGFEGSTKENLEQIDKSDEELINECKLSHLAPPRQTLVKNILRKHLSAFQRNALDLGKCKYVVAEAPLVTKNPPSLCAKYIPVPLKFKAAAQNLIDEYCKVGVFAPTTMRTTFTSNVFIIPKKNGKFRLIIDGRVLSNYCKPLPLALGSLEEIFCDLGGKVFVSVLDVSKAYDQIEVSEATSLLLSFFGPDARRYIYKRAGQGLKFSSYYLNKAIIIILDGLPSDRVTSYCDDLIIATVTFEEHLYLLEEVIIRFKKSGMKLSLPKLEIMPETVEFLGHIWRPGFIMIPKAKLTAYSNMRVPKSKTEVQFLINSLSFYRNFIPNFSEHIHPIRKMLVAMNNDKSVKFQWSLDMQKGLDKVLAGLAFSSQRYLPKSDRPFIIKTDASKFAAGAIVCQYDDNGELQLVAAVSRSFNQAERSLAPVSKEILTLTYTLSSLNYILRGAVLTIFADAKSMVYIKTCSGSSDYLTRLGLLLANHDFELCHVQGKLNIEADAISRMHKVEDQLKQQASAALKPMTREESLLFLEYLQIPDNHLFTITEIKNLLSTEPLRSELKHRVKQKLTSKILTRRNILPEQVPHRIAKLPRLTKTHPLVNQLNDLVASRPTCNLLDTCQPLLPCLQDDFLQQDSNATSLVTTFAVLAEQQAENPHESIPYKHMMLTRGNLTLDHLRMAQVEDTELQDRCEAHPKSYEIRDGLIHKKVRGKHLPVLPRKIIYPMVLALHYHALSGHRTPQQILHIITEQYYADDLKQYIKKLCSLCFICAKAKAGIERKPLLREIEKPSEPRQNVAFDIFAGLPEVFGFRYVYVFVDEFSLYTAAFPMSSKTTEDLLTTIQTFFAHQSFIPRQFTSDNESGLMTQRVQDFFASLSIVHNHGAPHTPWTNLAETAVRKVKEALRATILALDCEWPEALPYAVISVNQSPILGTLTPASIHFASKAVPPLFEQNEPNGQTPAEAPFESPELALSVFHEKAVTRARHAWAQLVEIRRKRNNTNRESANKSRAAKLIGVGDQVWLRNNNVVQNRATADRVSGPWLVVEASNSSIFSLARPDNPTVKVRQAHLEHLKLA